jgi:DNA-binding transcriptional ArsR family regulator
MSKVPQIHCLNAILQESFGSRPEQLGKQFLENFFTTQELKTKNSNWITIQHPAVTKLILASLGDEDKKNILNAVLDEPRTFMEILEITSLPPSSAYRKICTLIDNGLLIDLDSDINYDGKRKIKYKSIFQNIEINIEKNKVIVKMLLTKESVEKSFAIQTIRC